MWQYLKATWDSKASLARLLFQSNERGVWKRIIHLWWWTTVDTGQRSTCLCHNSSGTLLVLLSGTFFHLVQLEYLLKNALVLQLKPVMPQTEISVLWRWNVIDLSRFKIRIKGIVQFYFHVEFCQISEWLHIQISATTTADFNLVSVKLPILQKELKYAEVVVVVIKHYVMWDTFTWTSALSGRRSTLFVC